MLNSMTSHNWTPMFVCYVVGCGSKDRCQMICVETRLDYVLNFL